MSKATGFTLANSFGRFDDPFVPNDSVKFVGKAAGVGANVIARFAARIYNGQFAVVDCGFASANSWRVGDTIFVGEYRPAAKAV